MITEVQTIHKKCYIQNLICQVIHKMSSLGGINFVYLFLGGMMLEEAIKRKGLLVDL